MTTRPIEDCWREFVKQSFPEGFCCEEHERAHRSLYITGAMAALFVVTGWGPGDPPGTMAVSIRDLVILRDELAGEYHARGLPPKGEHH